MTSYSPVADVYRLFVEWRTLILSWYNCFRFPKPLGWWDGPVPQEVLEFNFKSQV